jgi:hypothetical protein
MGNSYDSLYENRKEEYTKPVIQLLRLEEKNNLWKASVTW